VDAGPAKGKRGHPDARRRRQRDELIVHSEGRAVLAKDHTSAAIRDVRHRGDLAVVTEECGTDEANNAGRRLAVAHVGLGRVQQQPCVAVRQTTGTQFNGVAERCRGTQGPQRPKAAPQRRFVRVA
jgi:hypothetical protein